MDFRSQVSVLGNLVIDELSMSPTLFSDVNEWCGFLDRTTSTLLFDLNTKIFTVQGEFFIYIKGIKIPLTDTATLEFNLGNGLYYIFYDVNANLCFTKTTWDILTGIVPVACLYLIEGDYVIFDKRYLAGRNLAWHKSVEVIDGTRYVNGFDAIFTNSVFKLNLGMLKDIDLPVPITLQVQCRLWYTNADSTGFFFERDSSVPYKEVAGKLKYGKEGALVDVTENKVSVSWVFASNTQDQPIQVLISDREFALISQARDFKPKNIVLPDALTPDKYLLYKLIFKATSLGTELVDFQEYAGVQGAFPYSGTNFIECSIANAIKAINITPVVLDDEDLDGGRANEVYLPLQSFDGGRASDRLIEP